MESAKDTGVFVDKKEEMIKIAEHAVKSYGSRSQIDNEYSGMHRMQVTRRVFAVNARRRIGPRATREC